MKNKKLNRQEKLDLLYGKGSVIDLVRSRAVPVRSMTDLLVLEDASKAGKLKGYKTTSLVEKENKLYIVDEKGTMNNKPASIKDIIQILDDYKVVFLITSTIYDLFLKEKA